MPPLWRQPTTQTRVREGTRGRHSHPARPTCTPRSSALRISHNPNAHHRNYPPRGDPQHPPRSRLPIPRPAAPPGVQPPPPRPPAPGTREDGAPRGTNDLDGDKHRRTLRAAENEPLT